MHHLVSDPASSLREGDVVAISAGWRASKQVRHVVTKIIAPFGPGIAERPAVPTAWERETERADKRERKLERRVARKNGGGGGGSGGSSGDADVLSEKGAGKGAQEQAVLEADR